MEKGVWRGDLMARCQHLVRAATEEGVPRQAAKHAAEAHKIEEVTTTLAAKVKSKSRTEQERDPRRGPSPVRALDDEPQGSVPSALADDAPDLDLPTAIESHWNTTFHRPPSAEPRSFARRVTGPKLAPTKWFNTPSSKSRNGGESAQRRDALVSCGPLFTSPPAGCGPCARWAVAHAHGSTEHDVSDGILPVPRQERQGASHEEHAQE